MLNMLEGKCPKCGSRYYGWALAIPRHQICDKCEIGLEITEDGGKLSKGYSPFSADEYLINLPLSLTSTDKKKRSSVPKSDSAQE